MTRPLTDIQFDTLVYWWEYYNGRGYYPTIEEARQHFGVVSKQAICDRLRACVKKGYIEQRARDGRYMLTEKWREEINE